jgi:hypothetical protein
MPLETALIKICQQIIIHKIVFLARGNLNAITQFSWTHLGISANHPHHAEAQWMQARELCVCVCVCVCVWDVKYLLPSIVESSFCKDALVLYNLARKGARR